jgi:hypothetical protein
MICARQLELDCRRWWSGNHGVRHGSLDASWARRNVRDLLAWSCLAYHVAARMQHGGVEVQYVEDQRGRRRRPAALVVHALGDHRAFDLHVTGDQLLKVRDNTGRTVASICLDRQDHRFLARVAAVVAGAAEEISASQGKVD